MTGKISYGFFVIVIGCFLVSGCIDFEPCENQNYLFELEFSMFPEPTGNLYSLGDTIRVYSLIEDALMDINTGSFIECGEYFLFPLLIGLTQFDSLELISANFAFNALPSIGSIDTLPFSEGSFDVRYYLKDATFQRELEFFLIPLEPGVFTLTFGYITTHYMDGFLNNKDECKSESAKLSFNVNNKESLGYELIESSGYFSSKEEYEEFGYFYSFEVID